MGEFAVQEVISAVQKSSKYRCVVPGLVERLSRAEVLRHTKEKEAVKAVKNKLHQIAGAYFEKKPEYGKMLQNIEKVTGPGEEERLKNVLGEAMRFHASSAERLPFLGDFYKEILRDIPKPGRVLDLACGLNPLARPWMGMPDSTEFLACDIFSDLNYFLNGVFRACGWKGNSFAGDLLGDMEFPAVDIVLFLKTLPCLEQVDKEASRNLLIRIQAPHLIVSFPGKSLGGQEKGMRENYTAHFLKLIEGSGWKQKNMVIGEELVFMLSR